jgi:hypothetical protein
MKKLNSLAQSNFEALKKNLYPGRGIIVGMDKSGKYLVQIYWIMGRSENSRNRVFVIRPGGVLKTAAADPAKVKDPSLIIYTAMDQEGGIYSVSNGDQTVDALGVDGLHKSLKYWSYEPDNPNFTPRITAMMWPYQYRDYVEMMILKKSAFNNFCNKQHYTLSLFPGFGYCMTTYSGDGNPLPPFSGDPYLVPLENNDIDVVSQQFWDALNEDNRVSLAVKFIDIKTEKFSMAIKNKYSMVE